MAGIIVELIAVFLLFCAALWFGAVWPYLVFPLYLGLLSLKVTPVGKRMKVSWVFLLSSAFGLTIALAVGYLAFTLLGEWGLQNPDSNLFLFFFGPVILRLFWSTVLGVVVALELLALALIPLAYLSAQGRYGEYDAFKRHRWQATRTALFGMHGLSQGRINVREGKAQLAYGTEDGLMRFGGPGELMVQEGNAVILERNGRVSRVVGSELTFLKPFERVSMVIPLQTRAEKVLVDNVISNDGIMIEQLEIWVFHTVALGPVEERTVDGQFEYNETILRTNIWSPSANDWREAVRGISDRMARRVVPKYALDVIMRSDDRASVGRVETSRETPRDAPSGQQDQPQNGDKSETDKDRSENTTTARQTEKDPSDAPTKRDELIDELRREISNITVRIGVAIRGLDLGAVKVSPEVRARLEDERLAIMAARAAEHHAAAMVAMEDARAFAQGTMIRAIKNAWSNNGSEQAASADLVIALRYIEALEKMASDPSAKVILPLDPRLLSSVLGSSEQSANLLTTRR